MQRFPIFSLTLTAVGLVAAHRFVRADGAQAGASDIPIGISPPDVQERYAATLLGTEILEAGEAFSRGELLAPDSLGRGVKATTGYAIAMQDATAAGDLVEAMLLQPGSVRPVYVSANGAIEPTGVVLVNGGAGLSGLTLRAPEPLEQVTIRLNTLTSGTVVLTLAEGVVFDTGDENTATFNAAGDELILAALDETTWEVLKNTSVTLSEV